MNISSKSRHLIDPDLLDLLDILPTFDISAESLAHWRNYWATESIPLPWSADAPEATIKVSMHSVEGARGEPEVRLRVYEPLNREVPVGAILHIHGGGYIGGTAAALEPVHRALSAELRCVLASVEYRLAPEAQFPSNIEDCYTGLCWLFSHAAEFNVDPQRIGVMGESAGGGLAAALALLARDRGEVKVAFQHLIYPMLDDRTVVAPDAHPFTGEFVWTVGNSRFGWSALLGRAAGGEGISPYAAPARAEDLSGLPPAFISAGALDLFLEENIEYARRLSRAGVPIELHVYPGAFHGFDLHPTARVARAACRDSVEALSCFLRGPRSRVI